MNDIEKEIQALEKKSSSKEEVAKLNSSVSQQTQQLLKSNADMGVKLGRADDQDGAARGEARGHQPPALPALAADRRDAGRPRRGCAAPASGTARHRAAAPSGAPRARTRRVVAPPAGAAPPPAELYDTASADYTKGRYALAIQGFEDYVASYPQHGPVRQRAVLDRRVPLRPEEVPRGRRGLRQAAEAVAQERQGRRPRCSRRGIALLELGQKAEAVVAAPVRRSTNTRPPKRPGWRGPA